MQHTQLGALWPVSRLTLGGGGLGQVWGATDRAEAVATVREAVDAGITLLDLAPLYGRGEAERVVGDAFGGRLPDGVHVTTKCQVGVPEHGTAGERIRAHLARSLDALRLGRVDVLLLHSNICPDGYRFARSADVQQHFATSWSVYVEEVVPTFEALQAEGLIGAWGITGVGVPAQIIEALEAATAPAVVQCIANCLDSAGDMRRFEEPARPREIIAAARARGIGVMGIRAVQAGALTDAFDRDMAEDSDDWRDYLRAAPLRALAAELGTRPAILAHRYALSMDGVDTVVLGVKNRTELRECLAAEAEGPLDAELMARIDALFPGDGA
ncbi:MAG TPA: aldo/keto reductase [Pseudomonadales bacterium]|nr:aldo/keto reductase [Pseudomonadales bacterium]